MPTVYIHNLSFEIDDIFEAGHDCDEAEAEELNRSRRKNIQNNWGIRVKRFLSEGAVTQERLENLRQQFTEYARDYRFGTRLTRPQVDPVQREAERIARNKVLKRLRESGEIYTEEDVDRRVEEVLATRSDIFDT